MALSAEMDSNIKCRFVEWNETEFVLEAEQFFIKMIRLDSMNS